MEQPRELRRRIVLVNLAQPICTQPRWQGETPVQHFGRAFAFLETVALHSGGLLPSLFKRFCLKSKSLLILASAPSRSTKTDVLADAYLPLVAGPAKIASG